MIDDEVRAAGFFVFPDYKRAMSEPRMCGSGYWLRGTTGSRMTTAAVSNLAEQIGDEERLDAGNVRVGRRLSSR
jgi:hypothetical protein